MAAYVISGLPVGILILASSVIDPLYVSDKIGHIRNYLVSLRFHVLVSVAVY